MTNTETTSAATSKAAVVGANKAPRVFGLTPRERFRRQLPRLGVEEVAEDASAARDASGPLLLVRDDVVCETPFLRGLLKRPGTLVEDSEGRRLAAHASAGQAPGALAWLRDGGPAPEGMTTRPPEDVGERYNFALRKREAPYCLEVRRDALAAIEWRIYRGTYKGVTDAVTKYLWPRPAFFLTRWFLRAGLGPNAVTLAGAALMLAALALFAAGGYALGLAAAWGMALLDTVDGKMARVSFASSTFGELLDHGIDLVHPPFWYVAWMLGLASAGTPLPDGWFGPLAWTVFATYIGGRLGEGYFQRRFGFHIHVWRRADSRFRLILARRNPNLVLLTLFAALGRPDIAVVSVAVWHGATLAAHVVQIGQAEWRASRSGELRSWLEAAPGIGRAN